MEPIIAMQKVESSQIRAAGYDAATAVLAVLFTSGSMYHYTGVPEELWRLFNESESKGKFFGAQIKPIPTFIKITSPHGIRLNPCPCGNHHAQDYGACNEFEVSLTGRCVNCDHSGPCHERDKFNAFFNEPCTLGIRPEYSKATRARKDESVF